MGVCALREQLRQNMRAAVSCVAQRIICMQNEVYGGGICAIGGRFKVLQVGQHGGMAATHCVLVLSGQIIVPVTGQRFQVLR